MKIKIIYIIGAVVIIFISFFVFKNVSVAPSPKTENQENEISKVEIDPNIPGQTLPLSNDPKTLVWAVFQKYLNYNKDRNLDGIKSVVYKIAPVCEDLKLRIDCEARMNLAYQYGNVLKKEDFKNVWNDQKQIILATDFWLESSEDLINTAGLEALSFLKGVDGEWKLLSFNPTKGGATNKGSASQQEIDERLIRYTEDNDQDGAVDYEEECLHQPNDSTCLKTSPKLRDTDGNGFWDGVEALMK